MQRRDPAPPAAPAFTTARAMVDVGDDDDDENDGAHFAPHYVSWDAGASDDELEGGRVHRDAQAAFVFAPAEPRGADALNQWMERPGAAVKPDFSALLFAGTKNDNRRAVFIPFAKTAQPVPEEADVPLKELSVFADAGHTFFRCTHGRSPADIMRVIKRALQYFDALEVKEDARQWRLDVSCLCVAEQIDFSIRLARLGDDGSAADRSNFEVGFHHTFGDEARFLPLMECIRTRCREIDDEPLLLPFDDDTLEPWMDARQEISDPNAAIDPKDALELVKQLHADVHAKTLFEIAKEIKDHCRHKSSRTTFHRVDPKNFLMGVKNMLESGSLDMSRFGVFILLQFAKDHDVRDRNDAFSPFFHSPYEKSSFVALLNGVLEKHRKAPCGAFTAEMVHRVQRSWLFA